MDKIQANAKFQHETHKKADQMKNMLIDFTIDFLTHKPEDAIEFAANYFEDLEYIYGASVGKDGGTSTRLSVPSRKTVPISVEEESSESASVLFLHEQSG